MEDIKQVKEQMDVEQIKGRFIELGTEIITLMNKLKNNKKLTNDSEEEKQLYNFISQLYLMKCNFAEKINNILST